MKKILLIILDGAGDAGKNTPLERAHTPNLDTLVSIANLGLLIPINKGLAPESDGAMISILGNNAQKVHTGRGIIEAVGSNVKLQKTDLVLRANIETLSNGRVIKGLKQKLSKQELKKINSIDKDIKLIPTLNYRAVLKVNRGNPGITNSHPGYKIVKNKLSSAQIIRGRKLKRRKIKALNKAAESTATKLNDFSKQAEYILKTKTILLRGASKKPPKLKKLKNWVCIADTPVEYGVAKLSGMEVIKPKPDLKQEAKQVKGLLKYHNVYIQIKGPDTYGHAGDKKKKTEEIEKIDKQFFKEIVKLDLAKHIIIVTSDHSTPVKRRAHGKEPTPLLITGIKRDKTTRFTESQSKKGALKTVLGQNLLKKL